MNKQWFVEWEETNKKFNQQEQSIKNYLLEQLQQMNYSYPMKIIRPWWNETALVEWIIEDQEERKKINASIMKAFSNHENWKELVEQVGFVSYDKQNPRLMMAWWEFCWNATRSFVWDLLDWKPWDVHVQVSWVWSKLKAWVKENWDAWSQMPVYKSFDKLYASDYDENSTIVEMEWITHLVTATKIPFSPDEEDFSKKIKEYSFEILKKNNLTDLPASWVMYLEEHEDGSYKITPIVYVKSIDTLFLEWACWSWTTAVWLLLAKQKWQSIYDYPIVQYSWIPIHVTVNLNEENNSFDYADISWPVNKIFEWKLRTDLKNDVVIQDNIDDKSLQWALKEWWLTNLYKELFWEAPYFEKFTDEEVEEIFNSYKNEWELYFAISNLEVTWFWASMPFNSSSIKDVEWLNEELESLWVDPNMTVYMADLWVSKKFQRKGIGEQLVNSRIESQPTWTIIIMRTSVDNLKSQSIYRKWNFKELTTKQLVEMERVDWTGKRVDERLFLITKK